MPDPARRTVLARRTEGFSYEVPKALHLVPGAARLQPLTVAAPVAPVLVPRRAATLSGFEAQDYDDNVNQTGSAFIPSDPHGTVGPNHVLVVNNVLVAAYDKSTGSESSDLPLQTLQSFFGAQTATFDPKAIYDAFSNRYLIVDLEREEVLAGDDENASRILLAASPIGTVAGSWNAVTLDAALNINGTDGWCDYPGFAVDEEALYITCNYFSFGAGSFLEVRLYTLDKSALYGGTFDAANDVFVYDFVEAAGGGFQVTTMPAQVHSDPGSNIGTWLVQYSGLSGGGSEAVALYRVDSPLAGAGASFTFTTVGVGNIDDTGTTLPDAPQAGSATGIETNDRRALDAVWRDASLWMTATVLPPSGNDAGDATAHVFQINTTTETLTNQADVGAEDLGNDTFTFFPSVSVNDDCAVVGFSASNSNQFVGSYYTGLSLANAAPAATQTARMGEDTYVRTFGSTDNRWGDYSATVLDRSDDGTFWFIHKYAQQEAASGAERGKWGQYVIEDGCASALPIELGMFEARTDGRDVVLTWQTLSERQNAGFEVQVADPLLGWQALGWVEGQGVATAPQDYSYRWTPETPGLKRFRLKQVDLDGGFSYSPEVELRLAVPDAFVLTPAYPNPFNPRTQFALFVQQQQFVRVAVFNALGQEVAVLYDGPVLPETRYDFTFEASSLPSGLYLYRVVGEAFTATRQVLLVK